jgi:uncharacterized membrane protein
MTRQEASHVINLPVDQVEKALRDVSGWPRFVVGVESVERTAFERYVFRIQDGGRIRQVPVAVVSHPGEHRIIWHARSGPAFEGQFRLSGTQEHRTRVQLTLVAEPDGFLSGLGDLVATRTSTAEFTLLRLDAELTGSGPEPTAT